MIDAINASQISMIQDQLRLQSVSQNISNMHTPGYKRQLLHAVNFDEQLAAETQAVSQTMLDRQMPTQGSLVQTQNTNEFALAGEGYFAVQTEEGVFYTRRGDFHLNEQGELCSITGGLILGNSGPIHVDDNAFTIDSQGFVYSANRKIEQLALVQFKDVQAMKYRGQGLYETTETPTQVTGTTRILQGFIEQSNVTTVDEMMEMVKISRHFEASQKVMHIADSLLSTAINQLGEGHV